jgi:signal transduction histidine kinase
MWVRLAIGAYVLVLAVLTVSLNNCACDSTQWLTRIVLVSVVVVSFCVELVFRVRPRWLFTLLVGIPVGWLIFTGNASVAPLFLLALVGWIVFTGSLREAVFATAIAIVAVIGYVHYDTPDRWLPWIAGIAATGLFMRMLVAQRELVAELRAAQADLARQAVANERRRIAGEIHDIAAHALAVTVLHLTGARMRVQREGGAPELVESLAQAERLGRQSLDDVRRTVGLLREDAEVSGGAAPPLPGAADVEKLVAEYRSAGLQIDLETRGSIASVPSATGLAVYRIIQESLANAVKHAPGARVTVCLEVNGHIHVRVHNALTRTTPVGQDAGHGIEGMQERVRLLGGSLHVGRAQDGWVVECTLPENGR